MGQPLGANLTVTSWPFYATGPSLLVAGWLQLPQEAKGVPQVLLKVVAQPVFSSLQMRTLGRGVSD